MHREWLGLWVGGLVVGCVARTDPTGTPADSDSAIPEPVGADIEDCRLPNVNEGPVDLGAPPSELGLATRGTARVTVLFATYTDVVPERTPQQVFELVDPGAAQVFDDMSYGAFGIELAPHFEWLPLSGPASTYASAIREFEGHRDFLREAVALADDDVDFSQTDLVLLLGPPSATEVAFGPTWIGFDAPNGRIEADGNVIVNGITSGADLAFWGHLWLNHEMGHSLGLPDLYSFDKPTGFTRPFSLMDYIDSAAPEYFAYERWHLGWVDDAQVLCDALDQPLLLAPVERTGGTKLALVRINETTAVAVESRRAEGWDAGLLSDGVVVTVVDTSMATGAGPIRLRSGDVPLQAGESIDVRRTTIEVLDSRDDGDVVQLSR